MDSQTAQPLRFPRPLPEKEGGEMKCPNCGVEHEKLFGFDVIIDESLPPNVISLRDPITNEVLAETTVGSKTYPPRVWKTHPVTQYYSLWDERGVLISNGS